MWLRELAGEGSYASLRELAREESHMWLRKIRWGEQDLARKERSQAGGK